METRQVQTKIELRDSEEQGEVIEGYALKFNKPSQVLGGWVRFIETIDQRALDKADMSNVVATFNHDQNQVLGRSGVNLDLEVDNIGLKFKVTPTNTSYSRDLMENIKAGVINQCSFAFDIPDSDEAETWEESDKDGVDYDRTIRQIGKLYDVSVVTTPAYPDTEATVGERSKKRIPMKKSELEKRKLKMLKEEAMYELERVTCSNAGGH